MNSRINSHLTPNRRADAAVEALKYIAVVTVTMNDIVNVVAMATLILDPHYLSCRHISVKLLD